MAESSTFLTTLQIVGGAVIFILGISFFWKFIQASLFGKITYWSGFLPITIISPFLCHFPPGKRSLIKVKQSHWFHLLFGPVFFLLSLMFLTSGADLMGLPGARVLNAVLTFGRPDLPPAIVYSPPFHYRFPMLKKAKRTVVKTLTTRIPFDRSKSLNEFERQGRNVELFTQLGEDEEE